MSNQDLHNKHDTCILHQQKTRAAGRRGLQYDLLQLLLLAAAGSTESCSRGLSMESEPPPHELNSSAIHEQLIYHLHSDHVPDQHLNDHMPLENAADAAAAADNYYFELPSCCCCFFGRTELAPRTEV